MNSRYSWGNKTLDSSLCWWIITSLWLCQINYLIYMTMSSLPELLALWKAEIRLYHLILTICFLFKITLFQNLLTKFCCFCSAVILCCLCSSTKSSPRWHQALFQELFLCAWKFSFWMCAIRGIIGNGIFTVAKSNWHCSFSLRGSFDGIKGHSATMEITRRPVACCHESQYSWDKYDE